MELANLSTGTIAEGELPVTPELTPGWGVAGAILIIAGAAYALAGIRSIWLHCFFSIAFLAAVGTTLLIVYVMTMPITDAVQGYYVVAVVLAGAALGGASLVFKDVMECFACLLGGFCLAMWLLTLKAGGLTGSGGAGTIIFTCVFSAAGFAGFFSKKTRDYYMIVCMALSGSTATVLGIDCFSRAGLKEFWAWIWNLNGNIFPYDATTYPLTRGIRVEQAVTIILMLGGIVSQWRLWKDVKKRKALMEEERRKDQEAGNSADVKAGDEIERTNAHERSQWEAVHGDMKSPTSVHTANDSGVGDMDSVKKSRHSGTVTTGTRRLSVTDGVCEIEMPELPADTPTQAKERSGDELRPEVPPKTKTGDELVMGKSEKDGQVIVRVAVDEVDATAADEPGGGTEQPTKKEKAAEAQLSSEPSTQPVCAGPSTPVPEVVPLPFKVPQIETDEYQDGHRSSFATFADVEDDLPARRSIDSGRSSFAKRLSAGSTNLLQRLSRNSVARQLEAGRGPNESQEDLVLPVRGDRDSMAATFDEESSLGEDDAKSRSMERPFSAEVKGEQEEAADPAAPESLTGEDELSKSVDKGKKRAESVQDSKQGKSIASEADSKPASLTRDRLPRALSKIALSYRTNEWAKHLSHAEIPTPEQLQILEPIEPQVAEVEEAAVPVNMSDLQKTAENAVPPPAMPRTLSAMSAQQSNTPPGVFSAQNPANLVVPASRSPPLSPTMETTGHLAPGQPSSDRSSASGEPRVSSESRQAAIFAAAAALSGEATSSSDNASNPIHSRPPVPGVVSYNSPQSLLAKRDMLLRAKNQALNRPESKLRTSHMTAQGLGDAAAYGMVAALGPGSRVPSYTDSRMSGALATPPVDLDNLPLNQRKALIRGSRRNSMSSTNSNTASPPGSSRRSSFVAQRRADLPSQVARESLLPNNHQQRQPPYLGVGMRQSSSPLLQTAASGPLINQVYGVPGTSSSNSLLPHQTSQAWNAEVSRDIDAQRQFLMSQKEGEARRRESARVQRESMGRKMERRMRTDSQLMEAHREAMRKMQRGASQQA